MPDDPFAETAADIAKRDRELAKFDSPAEVAKREMKRQEEHARGVRLGWWNEAGEPIEAPDSDEDQDDETEEDE